jgi:hypothetical protein
MPRVRFEPKTPVFERAKTVHTSDRAATPLDEPLQMLSVMLSSGVFAMSHWSSGQSSWLQIQKSGFDYRSYQIF